MARFHILAAVVAVVIVAAHAVDVYDVRPDAIHAFTGTDKIEICGCGFTRYNSVLCVFNGQWSSSNSWIVDDGTVICEAPAFPKEYFLDGLAQDFSLHLVFDNGNEEGVYVGNVRVGPQPNYAGEQIAPQFVRRAGGGTLVISGSLFADNWDAPPTVYFDDVPVNVSSSGYTDTTISATIPAGKLNQNARISVRFHAGGYVFYMNVEDTLRYGPFVTGITQTCVDPNGGTLLTVTGQNLDDTSSSDSARPLIIVSYEQAKNVDHSSANPGSDFQISLLGSSPSATSFTFNAPDVVSAIANSSISTSNDFVAAWGLYVSVDIYFDQQWSRSTMETGEPLYILDDSYLIDQIGTLEPQTVGYRYGGYVIHSHGVTVQGTRASTPTTPDSFAHFGGQDQVCIQFCGTAFVDFDGVNGADWDFYYNYGSSTQSICDSNGVTRNGDNFCCTTVASNGDECDSSVHFYSILTLPDSVAEGNNEVFDSREPELSNSWADEVYTALDWAMTVGPYQVSDEFRIVGVQSDVSGVSFPVYAANYARSTGDWTTKVVSYSSADGLGEVQDSTTFSNTNVAVTTTVEQFYFDVTNFIHFDFNGRTCATHHVHWGPLCGPWYLDKDDGTSYDNEEFDNFDIDDLGLSSRFVGLNSGSVSIVSDFGSGNSISGKIFLCERGSFPTSTAAEDPFDWYSTSSRFDDNNVNEASSCTIFQEGAGSSVNIAQLPTNNNQILWGEQYDVFMYFQLDDVNQLFPNYETNYAESLDFTVGTNYNARTRCGRIRVGCTATDSSCSSPFGPSQGFYELNADGSAPEDAVAGSASTIGSVQVTGQFMDNPAFPEVALLGYSASTTLNGGSGGLNAGTQWNKEALTQSVVSVVCDICNKTDPATAFRVRYGPQIIYMDIDNEDQASIGDLWGASCTTDASTTLSIYGYRFSDYIINDGMYENDEDSLDASYDENEVYITVFVDGVQAEFESLEIPQDTNEVQTIVVTLPVRPFGTPAVVKVYFGKQFNADDLRFGENAATWNHYLVAHQKVWYCPLIVDASVTDADDLPGSLFGYAASAHGLREITVTGVGFLDGYDDKIFCYLDDFVAQGEVQNSGEVLCRFEGIFSKKRMDIVPNSNEYQKPDDFYFKYGAEFNTNVSFHLEVSGYRVQDLQYLPTYSYGHITYGDAFDHGDPLSVGDGLNNYYGEVINKLGVHDVKIQSDLVFHWGPVCTATSQSASSTKWLEDTIWDDDDVDLSGLYLQDCLSELSVSVNDNDYRTPWTIGDAKVEDTYCQARNVSIYMVWSDVNDITYTLTVKSQQDSLLASTWIIPGEDLSPENIASQSRPVGGGSQGTTISKIPCDFEGWFYIHYHDAHVTKDFQRNIYCEQPYVINQPTWAVNGATGTGPDGWGFADIEEIDADQDLPWLFGWGGNALVTTFSYNVETSDYLGEPQCIFSTVSAPVAATVSGSVVTCTLPTDTWQRTGTLSIRFTNGGDSALLPDCVHEVARYTYGPGVIDEQHCLSPFAIDCTGGDITFHAYGPTCCGLDTQSHVIFGAGYNPTADAWAGASPDLQSLTVPRPGGHADCPDDSQLTSSNFHPLSSLGPIGIAFYEDISNKATLNSQGDCNSNNNVRCLFNTIDGSGFNQVCFGPVGESDIELVRYTYTTKSVEEDQDIDDTTAHEFTVGFAGVSSSWLDYTSTFVDFCKPSGCNDDRLTDDATFDPAAITVNLREAMYDLNSPVGFEQFTVKCGDPYNYVRFRVVYGGRTFIVREEFFEFTAATSSSPEYADQVGDEVRITLDHSPKIVSVTPSCPYDQDSITYTNPRSCTNADDGILRASEYGLLQLDVTISNVYDFYQPTETVESVYNYGKFGVIGYLGNAAGTNFVSRASVGDLTGDENYNLQDLAYQMASEHYGSFVALASDITSNAASVSGGDITVRFIIPPGEFNSELYFHAHLNPHIDAFTTTGDAFSWLPYVTDVSKTWVVPRGHENLMYKGRGFVGSPQLELAPLHTVLHTSNNFVTGPELQSSCRIFKDDFVSCLTPAFSSPSTSTSPTLQFTDCDSQLCDGDLVIPTNQALDILGTVAIAPQTISNDGGTIVYFPFYGMDHFATEQIFCGFPELQSVGGQWLFPVQLNATNFDWDFFDVPVYSCFIPDLADLTLDSDYKITTLNLYRQENTEIKCDQGQQPFLTTLSSHPVEIGFPCARHVSFESDNPDLPSTNSGENLIVVFDLPKKYGTVSLRGDFFPEVNGTTGDRNDPVNFRCFYQFYTWAKYINESDTSKHARYRESYSDLADGPYTYSTISGDDVQAYGQQWDCYLPENTDDDHERDFDVLVITAVYRDLMDDSCRVVIINSAAALASSLVLIVVALVAALF